MQHIAKDIAVSFAKCVRLAKSSMLYLYIEPRKQNCRATPRRAGEDKTATPLGKGIANGKITNASILQLQEPVR